MSAFTKLYEKMKKHYDKGHFDDALKVLRGMPKDMKLSEDDKGHYFEAMGMCYVMQGDLATGLPYLKQALEHPSGLEEETRRRITSNYVMYSHYLPDISDEALRDAHFSYAKHFSSVKPFSHEKKDKEKIRIGYISTNVYDH
ncbi:MAG: hypothetical protein IJU05_06940, partial [Schwartzia sp.]|nr:hypothetical protein [Schwartzia sp. (in: firmicutes)]